MIPDATSQAAASARLTPISVPDAIRFAREHDAVDLLLKPRCFSLLQAKEWLTYPFLPQGIEEWLAAHGFTDGSRLVRQHAASGFVVFDIRDDAGSARVTLCGTREYPILTIRLHERYAPTLDELGYPEPIPCLHKRSQGIIILTGPGGSGKSSLGAAYAEQATAARRNVWLLESPPEYLQPSPLATSFAVGPNGDFPTFTHGVVASMTAALDVLVVGQVNDADTARAAFDAARLGTLVVATMLSGDTAQALAQLLDYGIPLRTIADLLVGVVALRLVPAISGRDPRTNRPLVALAEACPISALTQRFLLTHCAAGFEPLREQLRANKIDIDSALRAAVSERRISLDDARACAIQQESI